jgi:ubiquinone/menaquinone biosynthesis C-methylase UbiE
MGVMKSKQWSFMNCGYAIDTETGISTSLASLNYQEKFQMQLYFIVATGFRKFKILEDQNVLEVGSGRGGGLSYVKSHLKPASALGIDISVKQVQHATKNYSREGLHFIVEDAENMTNVRSCSLDFVFCVEATH